MTANVEQRQVRNLLDDIGVIEQITKEDRLAEAYILLGNLEKLISDLHPSNQDTILKRLDGSSTISELRSNGPQIMDVLSKLRQKENWNAWGSKLGPHQDVSLYLHSHEPEGQYHFKTEGYLRNVSIIEAAAAILENDQHRFWIPMCTSSKAVNSLSPHRRIIQAKFDFVLLKKTALMEVRGDVLPDGALLLTFYPAKKPTEESSKFALPKDPKDGMDLIGGILLQDIDILESPPRNEFQDLIDFVEAKRQQPLPDSDGVERKLLFGEGNKEDDASVSSRQPSSDSGRQSPSANSPTRRAEDVDVQVDETPSSGFETPKKSISKAGEGSAPTTPWTEAEQAELGIIPRPARKSAVIKVQALFMADLKIDFIPDWIFNLGLRSTLSMFIPMLGQQSLLFAKDGLHFEARKQNADLYNVIEERIRDYTGGK